VGEYFYVKIAFDKNKLKKGVKQQKYLFQASRGFKKVFSGA
jgi:hypothetical protein